MKNVINVRVRIVIIKNNKLLVQYRKDKDHYFYVGGHLEYGETIGDACIREIAEECNGAKFEFKKIVYIRDFIMPEKDEHSLELFILGDIDKFEELEHLIDPEHTNGSHWTTWLNMDNLPSNLLPEKLTPMLLNDYKEGFKVEGKYVGLI
ncbi:MAG: NUDIX domain-containing protein [bacterium]